MPWDELANAQATQRAGQPPTTPPNTETPLGVFGPPAHLDPLSAIHPASSIPGAHPWQAPSEIEQHLYEAKMRGDWRAYLDVLAETRLFHPTPRQVAETKPDIYAQNSPYWNPQTNSYCRAYFTPGMLPAPATDPVYFSVGLRWLAEKWNGDHVALAVNPGTPCEMYLPAPPAARALWYEHGQRAAERAKLTGSGVANRLRTLRTGGPLQGSTALGLACGALLCVSNGSFWNAMAWHGTGFHNERDRLKDWWGITDREGWQRSIEGLLNGKMSSRVWEFALEVRVALARAYGGRVDPGVWRETVEDVMRRNAAEHGETPSATSMTGIKQLIGRITRYEARFRADALLPEHRHVRSVLAWDYGRASKMARWGLGARFCDMAEAERAVIRAGRAAQVTYHSWQDFSAGYILGRCLHFDEEEFGDWYTDMLDAHRTLLTEAESPWLTISWK
ncbi:DUF1266 domain-containing protein [Streptomyces sp. Da 82-17]|uniref:DUF1266 domain-containing protein n=1 Tax=Streptomyces sp. Da 82-17 TaxID=3377116 RepID=UPI0038D503DD